MPAPLSFAYLADRPEYCIDCAMWTCEAWGKYNPDMTLEYRIGRFGEHCNHHQLPITLLAFVGEELAGMASLRANDGARPDIGPWLGSLYVDAPFRHQGIGQTLVKKIEAEAQRFGQERLYLLTFESGLVSWYETLGWCFTASDTYHNNPVTIMERGIA